jgi:kynureninase
VSAADLFASPPGTYLLSHSVGLPLAGAQEQLGTDYFDTWATDPEAAWPTWLQLIDEFRGALAGLLGGDAASYCPQQNVSSGFTKILQAVRLAGRTPVVLLTEEAFPSLGFVCEHAGYEVRYIPSNVDVTDVSAWAGHVRDDVDVVLITQVHSNTGQLVPVVDVAALARQRGALSVVDVAQSVGVIPIDVDEWRADFLVGSCVKWLCGGPGAGWMWVAPDVLDRCAPTDVGWFSHADPFEFDIHRFRYADDALRFWGGTPSVLPFAVARRSIDAIAGIGVDTIRSHNLELTDRLIERCGSMVVSPLDADRRSGTVVVDPDTPIEDALAALRASGVRVDARSTGLRISPHVYNSADDIERAAAILRP